VRLLERYITKSSRFLDSLAGWGIAATMLLVVVNIILRIVFKAPIQGVYEYVGFLTAAIIGFAIAYCAIQNAHISIGFLVEKLPCKVQKIIQTASGTVILIFLVFASYQTFMYAREKAISGEVSATAHMPFYPFIIMVAIGLLMLCLVEIVKVLKGVMVK